jgi:hypothetical protein
MRDLWCRWWRRGVGGLIYSREKGSHDPGVGKCKLKSQIEDTRSHDTQLWRRSKDGASILMLPNLKKFVRQVDSKYLKGNIVFVQVKHYRFINIFL